MGPGGLEPPTPRLSSVCSNQLSYEPFFAVKPHLKKMSFLFLFKIFKKTFFLNALGSNLSCFGLALAHILIYARVGLRLRIVG